LSSASSDALDGVLECLAAARSGAPAMGGLKGVLRELAERGFVAIGIVYGDSPVAELLSVSNVGGVTVKSSFAPGVPPAAWESESSDVVLAASSQCMRLLLARTLSRAPLPSAPGAPAT